METIDCDSQILAYLIQQQPPTHTSFVTPPDCGQQVGYIVYKKNEEIQRHFHRPIRRELVGTTEVLYVMSGRCIIDFYSGDGLITSREMTAGNLIVIVAGAHGLRMLEDTTLLEIKQGPYPGPSEKEKF